MAAIKPGCGLQFSPTRVDWKLLPSPASPPVTSIPFPAASFMPCTSSLPLTVLPSTNTKTCTRSFYQTVWSVLFSCARRHSCLQMHLLLTDLVPPKWSNCGNSERVIFHAGIYFHLQWNRLRSALAEIVANGIHIGFYQHVLHQSINQPASSSLSRLLIVFYNARFLYE